MKTLKSAALLFTATLLSALANAEPPETSGIVMRGGYERGYWFVDKATGMGLLVGFDIVADCSQTPTEFGFISYSARIIQGGLRVSAMEKGSDLMASVWRFTKFNCEHFLTELPLATGEVHVVRHDNDYFGLQQCEIKNNINAFGYSFEGTLYSPFGRKRQLSAHFWALFDCDTMSFPVNKARILLTK